MKLAALVALSTALWSGSAQGQEGRSQDTAVVVGDPDDRFVQSLLAQLEESHVSARSSSSREPSLSRIAAAERVTAVVRVAPGHSVVELWLASLQAGRPLLNVRLLSNGDDESLLLQCVMLLRSEGQPGAETKAIPAAGAPTAPTAPASAAEGGSLRFELGAGYNLASSQLRWASLEAAVGLGFPHALFSLRASLPWWGAAVEQPEGTAIVQSPGLALTADLLVRRSAFGFGIGPLLGARVLRISGTDSSASVKDEHAFLLEVGAEGRVECHACLGAPSFLSLRAGYLVPEAPLRFGGSERSRFGPIAVGAQLGVALEADR